MKDEVLMQTYDLIVVGAGPAGLLAALAAGRAGLRVALLDRKSDLTRLERLCGQTLVSVNDYYFNDLVYCNRRLGRIGFVKSGISFNYCGPVQNCYAWHIYSPSGDSIKFGLPENTRKQGDDGAVGIAIDKNILFQCLLNEVQAAGVEVLPGRDVIEVTTTDAKVSIVAGKETLSASYLIAADGTNSRIARLCGCNTQRTFYCYLRASGGYLSGLNLPELDILISSITYATPMPGFMFIFPRPYPGQHTVAFLTLDPRTDLGVVARYFTKENTFFASWFEGAQEERRLCSAQYIYSPVREPYRDRVLLAGDAGSCQELENTGAMLSGWKAGCAIAAAMRENRIGIASQGIAEYLQWWRDTYLTACPYETYMMNFTLPYVVDTEKDLNDLFKLFHLPLPACWNPYAAISHLGKQLQALMPDLAAQQPSLAQKLRRISLPLAELIRETTQACAQETE